MPLKPTKSKLNVVVFHFNVRQLISLRIFQTDNIRRDREQAVKVIY